MHSLIRTATAAPGVRILSRDMSSFPALRRRVREGNRHASRPAKEISSPAPFRPFEQAPHHPLHTVANVVQTPIA